ncbi:hypothetical protein IW261DRAFT_1493415 [Armillaria novae-zelandiae]|uniref:Uncharacterized protein n=1 Tax=Armillaria novae-zelandiae TaxID=153914 RepID=A0AA39TAD9_9AGAR|nr:hypothetical protein IW261DRAFT_1493415 [Armillaria novae-zelandiae]
MATFPPELVEIIIWEIWHTEMPSIVRQSFMTTCPRINRTWKAVFAPIASQDIYIPSLAYIYYVCDIAGRQRSIIYHDLIPRLTRTITCFADLREKGRERVAKEAYILLMALPNDIGLRALFPQVPHISFELRCIGGASYPDREIRGLPVHIRYDRFLSKCHTDEGEGGYLRLDIHVSIKTHSPHSKVSSYTLTDLRNAGLGYTRLFRRSNAGGEYETLCRGVLCYSVTSYVREYEGDMKDINWCLWMASKRYQSTWMPFLELKLLAAPRHYWQYKRLQWHLPAFTFRYNSNLSYQTRLGWPLINI